MTYTEHDFSLKSGFKKIVLTPDLVLVLSWLSQKQWLDQIFFYITTNLKLDTFQNLGTCIRELLYILY